MSDIVEAPLQKPRLVLMGEFSSGKSTLSNILLGATPLPMQVTATRLPPVHITHGEPSAYAMGRDGLRQEIDLNDLSALSPETTKSIHLTMLSDTLELCDLIDMPGISDPNMPVDTWDEAVGPADSVIWCTHATQAWRQSEAAVWERMRGNTSGMNLLLVTQFDKLRNPRDRERVLGRIAKEVEGKFSAVYPVSLLEALKAGEDFEAWKASGANAFMEHLIEMLMTPRELPEAAPAPEEAVAEEPFAEAEPVEPEAVEPETEFELLPFVKPEDAARPNHAPSSDRVIPRRVRAAPSGAAPERLPRSAKTDALVWPVEPGVS